ncbi:MAG: PilZ domain-containing protein [Myxococcota bacterium]
MLTQDAATERRDLDRRTDDRRRATRAPLDLWVEEERGNELYFRRTGNLSSGGVFFEQTIPHALGTRVKLRFTLPGESDVIEAVGEIVNTPQSTDGLGMGLKFLSIAPEHAQRIESFIGRHAAEL